MFNFYQKLFFNPNFSIPTPNFDARVYGKMKKYQNFTRKKRSLVVNETLLNEKGKWLEKPFFIFVIKDSTN
jgi:hypothetical protein